MKKRATKSNNRRSTSNNTVKGGSSESDNEPPAAKRNIPGPEVEGVDFDEEIIEDVPSTKATTVPEPPRNGVKSRISAQSVPIPDVNAFKEPERDIWESEALAVVLQVFALLGLAGGVYFVMSTGGFSILKVIEDALIGIFQQAGANQ
eukprot:CAMPEP_0196658144 /NCGR_PEP_ID=MMETSP1086-20130531/27600_1 /TAXON_ID=77921 /ORGANISM="Cyanoptyche  gloeocystis , Strain SAG4.97" /LENGTH=147 /DNA_ID=CAMNT_0041991581 /DNA_START=226 /DNA_END=669 /DNA_ORIENTATION=-